LGSDTLALLTLGAVEITGRFPPDVGLKAGSTVPITLAMAKFHLFDTESGLAIK
jgi:hypothetical protein